MKNNQIMKCTFLCFVMGSSLIAKNFYVSQAGQDKILNEHFFKNKKGGVFVDIGAHNGKSLSNTYFFEKALGWKGICFEPMSHEFEKLKFNRNCICINACVSNVEGVVPFILVSSPQASVEMLSGMLDTYDQRHLERMKRGIAKYGGSYQIINVPSVRLDKILKDREIAKIDYLSVDTEGGELEILKTINFNEIEVSAISVENNYKDKNLRTFLTAQGFTMVAYLHGYDELYIHNTQMVHLIPIPEEISHLLQNC